MDRLIAPSLLSADFGKLKEEIEMVNSSEADLIHIDIMDGVFVPNISFGFPVMKSIQKYARKPLDVHLMIIEPDRYVKQFRDFGTEMLSVHYEACTHLHRTISSIKNLGMKAGVVLNPHTPVVLLQDILTEIDFVLIMSVNPGFGGQSFIPNTYQKITELKESTRTKNKHLKIEVDGGVDLSNAKKLFNSGADILVAGNSVFSADNPLKAIHELKFFP
jgi:ribulose-phosphate 3-epimerase